MSGVFVYIPPGPDGKPNEGPINSSAGVYILRLSNPPLNILNKATRLKLLHDLEQAVNDANVKAIIMVGSEAAFSAGADINELNSIVIGHDKDSKKAAMRAYIDAYKEHNLASIVYAIDSCPKPVVALITGQCLGGGLELALGCQYRIATEDAIFRFPEALIGIIPGALGTQLLPRLVRFDQCLRMCCGPCESLTAKQALESGLIDQVLPPSTELEMPAGSNQRLESYLARVVKLVQGQLDRGGPTPYRRTSNTAVVTRNMADSSREAYLAMKKLPRVDRGGAASRGAIEALLACVYYERDFLLGAKVEIRGCSLSGVRMRHRAYDGLSSQRRHSHLALVVQGAAPMPRMASTHQPLPLLGLLAPALWARGLLPPYSSAVSRSTMRPTKKTH